MNLIQLFAPTFHLRKDHTGLEFEGREFTFADIDRRSDQMAAVLSRRGLRFGDRLCVYLNNRIEFIDVLLACLKLGVIFVPVNILYRERELGHIIPDADPRAVVCSGAFPIPAETWDIDQLSSEALALGDVPRVRPVFSGDTAAAIVYTSGTTGASKGAVLTHSNFAANAVNLVSCWKISADDRLLMPLPMFHVHGLGNAIPCWLVTGFRMRLLRRFEHESIEREFIEFAPTLFFGVPTMYVRLLNRSPEAGRAMASGMRLFVSGSAPLPTQVLEDFRSVFGHTILERYGMTETLMNISNPYAGERRPGTVGFPLPSVSVRILNESGEMVRDGETGELYIKGPNVFKEYWRRPDATAEAFRDGYFRTGDIGTRSEDGYYTLMGRRSDLIISGGFNIYPREIEEFLLEQPEVLEAAVCGVPDRVRGEIPVAYVCCEAAFDAGELTERCRAVFASFKIPRAFVRVDALPRTALGKVQKHLLPKPEGLPS